VMLVPMVVPVAQARPESPAIPFRLAAFVEREIRPDPDSEFAHDNSLANAAMWPRFRIITLSSRVNQYHQIIIIMS